MVNLLDKYGKETIDINISKKYMTITLLYIVLVPKVVHAKYAKPNHKCKSKAQRKENKKREHICHIIFHDIHYFIHSNSTYLNQS